MQPRLTLRLVKGAEKRLLAGYPWIHRGEYVESSEQVIAEPGELAEIVTQRGEFLGIGYFNAASTIACRVLTRTKEAITAEWLEMRLLKAVEKRKTWCAAPYFRAVHSEADGLPGLLIDQFGEILSVQIGTAGMERLFPPLMEAVERVFAPSAVMLRNDTSARAREGLSQHARVYKGHIPERVELLENACRYLADIQRGQKTGWFYDQRDNRALMASHAKGKHMLDIYSHSGGFGVLAAKEGARSVTFVDSSALALTLARETAMLNGVEARCHSIQGQAFAVMEQLHAEGKRWEVVVADPPAFVKTWADIASGMKGYEKVAHRAARLVEADGLLMVASCSHHATRPRFREAVLAGVKKAGRTATLLSCTGAGRDHPAHPALPQSEYLKALLLRLE